MIQSIHECDSKRHRKISKEITEFIGKDIMPLKTVTMAGFMALV